MEFGEILDQLKKRWIISERYELLVKLDEAPRGGATGGEGIGMIGSFLLGLKQTDPDAFNEVPDLVDEFAERCAENGGRLNGYNYK